MKGEDSEKGVLATGVVSHQGYTDNGNMTGFRGSLKRGMVSYQGYTDNIIRNMKGEDSEKGVLATGVY